MHQKGRPLNLGLTRRHLLQAAGVSTLVAVATGQVAQSAESLLTRPIPHSGETLPVVGLGTATGFEAVDQQQLAALQSVVDALIAAGAKLIDTASTYGDAEAVIGNLVERAHAREKLFLATKIEVRSAAASEDEFQRSLQKLRTTQVDLLQLHNVSRASQSLAQLRDWKAAGKCRYVGITSTFPGNYDAMEKIIRREKPDFVQVDYAMDDREAEKRIIPAAAEAGAAVLTALPFGRGSLFRAVKGKQLPEHAKDFDANTWAQFFLKFLLGNPHVTAVIPGTSNAEHMLDNLAAGRGRLPDEQQRQKMPAVLGG
jgi:aryl-alcohol dehydrogenase-like predicted oxidoreductase